MGDRHIANILIDIASAELVHIDLGVAFEQGKTLRTPEMVPFRLTRDLVDAMGVTGVEGVFRKCCEEVMRVLRSNREFLLTILEVFLHDPLYRWAPNLSSFSKIQKKSKSKSKAKDELTEEESLSSTTPLNKEAEKTLKRLEQKLQGLEYGVAMTVEGQVNQLINEAQDPERLCKMFHG